MEQTQVNDFFAVSLFKELFSLLSLLLSSYGTGALTGAKRSEVKFACGFALIAFMAWSFPQLTGFYFLFMAAVLTVLSAFGIYRIVRDFKQEKLFFVSAISFFILFFGSYALWPYSWDECVYQTALLKHYVNNGNNAVIPDNPFSCFPSLPHSLMRLGMEVSGGALRLARINR